MVYAIMSKRHANDKSLGDTHILGPLEKSKLKWNINWDFKKNSNVSYGVGRWLQKVWFCGSHSRDGTHGHVSTCPSSEKGSQVVSLQSHQVKAVGFSLPCPTSPCLSRA